MIQMAYNEETIQKYRVKLLKYFKSDEVTRIVNLTSRYYAKRNHKLDDYYFHVVSMLDTIIRFSAGKRDLLYCGKCLEYTEIVELYCYLDGWIWQFINLQDTGESSGRCYVCRSLKEE